MEYGSVEWLAELRGILYAGIAVTLLLLVVLNWPERKG